MTVTTLEALEKRRTIRNYNPNWKIPKEQLDKIGKEYHKNGHLYFEGEYKEVSISFSFFIFSFKY